MSDTAVQETPSLGKRSFWLIIAAIAVGNFSASLSSTTVTIMLPVFMSVFHADIIQVQWTLTGYMLASGIVAPMIGYLSDRLSLKRTYILALTGFLITSFLLGFSWSVGSLIGLPHPARLLRRYADADHHEPGLPGGAQRKASLCLKHLERIRRLGADLWPDSSGTCHRRLGWQWVFFMNVP